MSGKWKIAAVSIASIVLITVNLYLVEKKRKQKWNGRFPLKTGLR
ncbi:hypothetical protein RCO48_22790 [Peribacillus frigoritolerans]|nr:hypothetical protein [Peribacillus frigoritolerans]